LTSNIGQLRHFVLPQPSKPIKFSVFQAWYSI
jgi:hypothetical protein